MSPGCARAIASCSVRRVVGDADLDAGADGARGAGDGQRAPPPAPRAASPASGTPGPHARGSTPASWPAVPARTSIRFSPAWRGTSPRASSARPRTPGRASCRSARPASRTDRRAGRPGSRCCSGRARGTRRCTAARGLPSAGVWSVGSGVCPNICAKKPPAFVSVPSGVPGASPLPVTASVRAGEGPGIEALTGPLAVAAAGSASATTAASNEVPAHGSPFDEHRRYTPAGNGRFPMLLLALPRPVPRASCRTAWSRGARRAAAPSSRESCRRGPAHACVETLGVAAGVRVQDEQRLATLAGGLLGGLEEGGAARRRARRWTSILDRSARCGWFSGCASTSWTMPTMPVSSSATRSARSPATTSSATRRQNARALSGVERVQEADARTAVDAVDQHVPEHLDLSLVDRMQAADGDA